MRACGSLRFRFGSTLARVLGRSLPLFFYALLNNEMGNGEHLVYKAREGVEFGIGG